MKTITIHKSDFDINDASSIDAFNKKLKEIEEPFEVKFDFSIAEMPSYLFSDTNLTKITIPDSIVKINSSAFAYCFYLKQIFIPDSVKILESNAFAFCRSLEQVVLPDSITKINKDTFFSCEYLKELTLPSFTTSLENNILYFCPSLEKIIIQQSKNHFLLNVEGAKKFYDEYENLLSFEEKTLDTLLSKNNSIESIINNIELEH